MRSYRLDLGSETELRIQVRELLFDNAYLSKVIDDKKSWYTWMEVLDLIYHPSQKCKSTIDCATRTRAAHSKLPVDPCATRSL